MYHEMQFHWRQWTCPLCRVSFSARQQMERHLNTQHSANSGNDKLLEDVKQTLLELSEHRMDKTTPVSCPLCKKESPLEPMLYNCLGRHLEEISLLALPEIPGWNQETDHADQQGNDDRTMLSWAAKYGQTEIVKALLCDGRVDPNRPGKDGRTPLSWAAQNALTEVVEALLSDDRVRSMRQSD